MTDATTVEQILEAYWLLQGYWTKLRHPIKAPSSWAEVDLLAFNPATSDLVVAEAKMPIGELFGHSVPPAPDAETGVGATDRAADPTGFAARLGDLFADPFFETTRKQAKQLTIQLVSPALVGAGVERDLEREIDKEIKRLSPTSKKAVRTRLDTPLSILCEVVRLERNAGQGQRHGHPVIDMARELNRYFLPAVRMAGSGRPHDEEIQARVRALLLDAFDVEGERGSDASWMSRSS
jgi:hypothetical protein